MMKNLFKGNSDRTTLGGFLAAFTKNKVSALFLVLLAATSVNAQTILINPAAEGGFETGSTFASNGWTTVNATTNQWHLGTAAAWQTGTNAAYISNNGGAAWSYSNNVAQTSHFYRDVTFPAGETNITLNFDWRGNGNDGNWDNLQVYVVNTTITPTTAGPTGTQTTETEWTGYTNGTTGYYLTRISGTSNPTTTTSVSLSFSTAQAAYCAGNTRRLVFVWKNDGSGGDNPPASIDNISLTSDVCTSVNVPYLLDFESAPTPNIAACTSIENVGTGNEWYIEEPEDYGFDSKCLAYEYNSDEPADVWFYTQAINLTAGTAYRISYKYGTSSEYSEEQLKVAYGTAASATSMTNILEDHTSISNDIAVSNHVDFIPAATGEYYFGFQAHSDADQYRLFVDDIEVTIAPSCSSPTAVTASAIAASTATISWTASISTPSDGYEYEIRTSGAAGSGATGLVTSGTTAAGSVTKNIIGLSSSTSYKIYVRSNCGSGDFSDWTNAREFTTPCEAEIAPTAVQDFSTYEGEAPDPICWSEAQGVLAANTTLVYSDGSYWYDENFANAGVSTGATINLYGEQNEWLISNPIDLGTGNFRLKYDMAVTVYGETTAVPSLGSHKVSVVISTDGGATWSDANTLRTYTGPGSYSNTGQTETINLDAYTGIVKLAFVATTTSTSPDIEFHIDNFVVESIPEPAITNFTSTVACGNSTVLTVNGTDLAQATITIDGTPVVLTTNTNTQLTATISTSITGPIVVTTPGGTATSATDVTFVNSPAFALSGTSATLCAGTSTTTAVTVTEASDYTTYTWVPSAGVTGNETDGWIFNPASSTNYVLNVSNGDGCINTANYAVTTNALPTPTITANGPLAFCEGGNVVLTASGTTGNVWSTTATGNSITVSQAGSYTVTETDVNGCVGTSTAKVVVVNAIPAVPVITANGPLTFCEGGEVVLTSSQTTGNVWSGAQTTASITVEASGSHTVTFTDANGCSATSLPTAVVVNAVPVAAATVSNSTTLTATPAGQTYKWINCANNQVIAGATSATYVATANGSYKVVVTNSNGCADTSACVTVNKVGLDENTADLGITLYPNPTEGNVYVNMTSTEKANITVYDAQGKVVSTMSNIQNGTIIDLNNVQNGMYMIQVSNPTGSNIFRVVKN